MRTGKGERRRWWRNRKALQRGGFVILGLYLLLLTFPQAVFSYHVTHGRFTVYSTRPVPEEIVPVLDRAERLLHRSELDTPSRPQSVFLCNGFGRFAFFNPSSTQAVAANSFLGNNVFVVDADVTADRVRRDPVLQAACHGTGEIARTLSGTIAHETTHSLIRNRRGWIPALIARLPSWKEEGYCDVIAQESSFDTQIGEEKLRRGDAVGSPCFHYFVYREMVAYLRKAHGLDFDGLVSTPQGEAEVRQEMMQNLSAAVR